MKPWIPFCSGVIVSLLLLAFPAFMGFVVGDPGWAQAGWALYFFIVPFSVVLVIVGLIVSLILLRRSRRERGTVRPEFRR